MKSEYLNEFNRWKTRSLFVELSETPEDVRFTLKNYEYKGYPSLYKIYMDCNDPLEYGISKVLGGPEHWNELSNTAWFAKYINRWRHELELKIRADALKRIREAAESESKSSFIALKFLLDSGWKKETNPVGAPSRQRIQQAAEDLVRVSDDFEIDFKRLQS